MTETLPDSYCVDFSSTQQVDFAIKENEFTAGYTARDVDGINNVRDTWNVSFSELSLAEMEVLWDFLTETKGYIAFYWTPPREEAPRKWCCMKLTRSSTSSNSWTVQAVFQEQFIHHFGQATNEFMQGVPGQGRAGDFTITLEFAPNTAGVSGVQGVGTAADIFPSQVIQEYFQFNELKTYTDAVIQGDYMYAFYGYKHIVKIHVASFKAVDLFDIDMMSSLGLDTNFPFQKRRMAADSTYLYVNSHNTGKILRITLSDFRTTSIKNVALANAGFIAFGGMFVYGGKLWMLPGDSAITAVVRLDLSDFTTVDFLDWSSLVITGSPLALVQGFVVWDHYCTCLMGKHRQFVTDQNDSRSLQFDMDNFTLGGVKLTSVPPPLALSFDRWWKNRGSWDGDSNGWVYFANEISSRVIRINTAHTTYEVWDIGSDLTPTNDFINGYTGCWIVGTDLFLLATYPFVLVKVDLTTAATVSSNVFTITDYELIDVFSYALGDNPDNRRAKVGFRQIYGDSQWIYCFPNTTNEVNTSIGIRNNIPGILRVDTGQGAYYPAASTQAADFDFGIVDWNWTGDDFSYLLPTATDLWTDNILFSFNSTSSSDHQVYALAVSMKFANSGSTIDSITLGGTPCIKAVDICVGTNYAGIWYVVSNSHGTDVVFNTSDAVHYYDLQLYTIQGVTTGAPFVVDTAYGTGTDATFTYSVDDFGTVVGAITVDETPDDWDITFDVVGFDWDNFDWWGPNPPDWTDTIFDIQFSNENNNVTGTGVSLTVDWNEPGFTDPFPWVGCVASFNRGVTATIINKYIGGTIAQGTAGIIINPVFI